MITQAIFNMFFGMLSVLLGFLPDVEWVVNADMFTKFFEIIKVACYLLPMGTVVKILALIIAINTFKIFVALLRLITQLIPLW